MLCDLLALLCDSRLVLSQLLPEAIHLELQLFSLLHNFLELCYLLLGASIGSLDVLLQRSNPLKVLGLLLGMLLPVLSPSLLLFLEVLPHNLECCDLLLYLLVLPLDPRQCLVVLDL